MSRTTVHRTPRTTAKNPTPALAQPTRDELLAEVEPPLLGLDEIVIVGQHGDAARRLVISGRELAHVLSLRDQHNNLSHMVGDSGEVSTRLRGLAELLVAAGSDDLTMDGTYFLGATLRDLAARLDADPAMSGFSVFLRKDGRKKVAAFPVAKPR